MDLVSIVDNLNLVVPFILIYILTITFLNYLQKRLSPLFQTKDILSWKQIMIGGFILLFGLVFILVSLRLTKFFVFDSFYIYLKLLELSFSSAIYYKSYDVCLSFLTNLLCYALYDPQEKGFEDKKWKKIIY